MKIVITTSGLGKRLGNYNDKEVRKSIFGLLYLELGMYIEFWIYCVPVIFIPKFIIRLTYHIYKKFFRENSNRI